MSLTRLPRSAGLGLKPQRVQEILTARPDIGFFEIHAENYMGAGGAPHRRLEANPRRLPPLDPLRRRFPRAGSPS